MSDKVTIAAGEVSATVAANGAHGWCGLEQWTHRQCDQEWLLSPAFTLEHYIGVPMAAPDYIEYEPCVSNKTIVSRSSSACALQYAPLACSQTECSITYQMLPPHYVDVTIDVKSAREDWPLAHLALFFATIVRAPIYTGVSFIGHDAANTVGGCGRWIHFNGMAAQPGRTAHPASERNPELPRPANPPDTYYYNDSSVRFEQPYFYGQVGNMASAVMFRPEDAGKIRFVVNPLAPAFGGPAWDFFWIIRDPQPSREYRLSFRSLFKPFVSSDDISQEYDRYTSEISR